jgi:hypothetical protein
MRLLSAHQIFSSAAFICLKLCKQGDQIGQSFANSAIFFFGILLKIVEVAQILKYFYLTVHKSYVLILTKTDLATFWAIF